MGPIVHFHHNTLNDNVGAIIKFTLSQTEPKIATYLPSIGKKYYLRTGLFTLDRKMLSNL